MTTEDLTRNHRIMLLDIGNTNLKWAWLRDNHPGEITSVSHKDCSVEQLLSSEWENIQAPSQIYVSNVAGSDIELELCGWVSKNWSVAPVLVRSTAHTCGVTNAYREPERLGVDRWLTLIAMYAKFSGPICVVDCGTAVTIDVLGLDGLHMGGLILPGFGLMQHALLEHTAIPYSGDVVLNGLLATDTESAIAAGGVSAVAALVERIQQEITVQLGESLALVLTGSDAARLQSALAPKSVIETDLVMQGLIAFINDEPG